MKIYQVEDENVQMVESVLDAASRCPEGYEVSAFAFGMIYTDRTYTTGYYNASPAEMSAISGYMQLESSFRYIELNRDRLIGEGDCDG